MASRQGARVALEIAVLYQGSSSKKEKQIENCHRNGLRSSRGRRAGAASEKVSWLWMHTMSRWTNDTRQGQRHLVL